MEIIKTIFQHSIRLVSNFESKLNNSLYSLTVIFSIYLLYMRQSSFVESILVFMLVIRKEEVAEEAKTLVPSFPPSYPRP